MHQRPARLEKNGSFLLQVGISQSHQGYLWVATIALLLLGVLYHSDCMSTAPLCTKALGAESIHEVFFLL